MKELSPEARSVLDAGRDGDVPTSADRARVRNGLMQAIAAGSGAALATVAVKSAAASAAPKAAGGAAAVAHASGFLGAGVATKIVAVVAFSSAIAGGYAISRSAISEPSPRVAPVSTSIAAASPVVVAPVAAPRNAASAAALPIEEVAIEAASNAEPSPRATAHTSARSPAPSRAADEGPDPLLLETRELRDARRAAQSNPDRALALIDAQNQAHPDGMLSQERSAERAIILCKAGRVEEGKSAAVKFVADNPSSPLVDRVRAACAVAK